MRLNPQYTELAYRKALVTYLIGHLMDNVVAANGGDPKVQIVSEEVFRGDDVVPRDMILDYVEGLQEEESNLQLQLSKYEFKEKDVDTKSAKQQPQGQKKSKVAKKSAGPEGGSA